MGNGNGSKAFYWPRWAPVAMTAMLAVTAFTVQWGVVTTKLGQIEHQLGDIVIELRSMREDLASAEGRVSFLEGQLTGARKLDP